VSQWTRYDRTERALAPGLAQLSSLSSRLGLAPVFRERAAILLRQTIEAGLSRGRSMDAIVAAVVYLAAKQLGAPRGLHELAQATGVTVHRISLTAKVVSRELGVFSRASRAEDFVPRFASQLELEPRVGERALSLVARVKDTKTLEANSPVGIAAGALYLASEELDMPITQAQIARLTGVSEVTIRKHYRLLKELIDGTTSATEAA
jgi:transcription initiation factor TFIIB